MNIPSPNKNNIFAVIVTYQPGAAFLDNLQAISRQVGHTTIVDNGSCHQSQETLGKISGDPHIQLILNQNNLGLAAALNQGIDQTIKKEGKYDWVLLLDQDSSLEEFALEEFSKTYTDILNKETIAIFGSNHIDINSQEQYYTVKGSPKVSWIERKTVITSGSFIPISVIHDLGPFREDLFIDSIDHDYCLRARKKGYKNILLLQPLLRHSMGNRKIIRPCLFPFIQIITTNYPPFRWYFMTRNRLILCRDYLFVDPWWTISRFFLFLGFISQMMLGEKQRTAKLRYIGLGTLDALTNNMKRNISPAEA